MEIPAHPIIVHFPIALLILGLFLDLAALLMKREWLSRAALVLLVVGTLASVAAVRSGSAQAMEIARPPALDAAIEEHAESGKLTMFFFLALAGARGALARFRKLTAALHWVTFAAWIVGALLLARAGYFGGMLVYRHGAGVTAAPAAPGGPAAGRD